MGWSERPLGYCANVHAAADFAGLLAKLARFAAPLRERYAQPLAVGLWLSGTLADELASDSLSIQYLADWLKAHGLECHTMNAFPFGDFHAACVKQQVYLPDWTTEQRAAYTCRVAEILAALLPEGASGSISTVPLAFKAMEPAGRANSAYFPRLLELADFLAKLRARTGKWIRLAIEPEPLCRLENTDETLAFFRALWDYAAGQPVAAAAREFLGICFDVCHQAVEFEEVARALHRLDQAAVPIVKLHVTNALELSNPHDAAARAELADFAEPRYLHQVFAKWANGALTSQMDLTAELAVRPPDAWTQAQTWRVHFHVPVYRETMGRLHTTRPALVEALRTAAKLTQSPHLEVETYTWGVLPRSHETPADPPPGLEQTEAALLAGLHAEIQATAQLMAAIRAEPGLSSAPHQV